MKVVKYNSVVDEDKYYEFLCTYSHIDIHFSEYVFSLNRLWTRELLAKMLLKDCCVTDISYLEIINPGKQIIIKIRPEESYSF